MTTTIDTLIETYQTRLAEEKEQAFTERRAKEQTAITQALNDFAAFFGPLWNCVQFVEPNVSSEGQTKRPYVRLVVIIDGHPGELHLDINSKKSIQMNGLRTFYADGVWNESEWGQFFLAIRDAKAEARANAITRLANQLYRASLDELDELLEHAQVIYPNDFPPDWEISHTWQELADYRRAELQADADERVREKSDRKAKDREYEAHRQAAELEAAKFKPFIAYQLHYSVAQPGDEDQPYTTQTVYALHPDPDPDGWYTTIWRGLETRDRLHHVARTTELIITSPDDDHARSICQCDFEAGVYIRRTPVGAALAEGPLSGVAAQPNGNSA